MEKRKDVGGSMKTEDFDALALKAGTTGERQVWFTRPELKEFSKLLIADVLRVVAAQALLGEQAVDVYKNLKEIYEVRK
mgnify:CR=1 FL=1